jgi:hypothetical protein
MSRNPLLACNVLLRQCDQSFSNGATGHSPGWSVGNRYVGSEESA